MPILCLYTSPCIYLQRVLRASAAVMGKKKLSLKRGFRLRAIVSPMGGSTFGTDMAAVNRGFATTSVASKKQLEAAKEESAAKQDEPEANVAAPISIGTGGNGAASSGQATAKEDWEDEGLAEQNALQALVDRLHEKGEKEVSRIVKVSSTSRYS